MGILDALFGSESYTIEEVLRAVRCTAGESEAQFRHDLEVILQRSAEVFTRREAGVSGDGTRIDLYIEDDGVDHIITIKKGITAQKLKTLAGEVVLLRLAWAPRGSKQMTNVYVVIFDDVPVKNQGYLKTLHEAMSFLSTPAFDVRVIWCPPEGEDDDE